MDEQNWPILGALSLARPFPGQFEQMPEPEDEPCDGRPTAADFSPMLYGGRIEWWNKQMGRHPFSSFALEFTRGCPEGGFEPIREDVQILRPKKQLREGANGIS